MRSRTNIVVTGGAAPAASLQLALGRHADSVLQPPIVRTVGLLPTRACSHVLDDLCTGTKT